MTEAIQAHIDQFQLPHPSGTGHFRISVARHPNLAEGQAGIPVLFVLDADMGFALAAEVARLRGTGNALPTAMVVGIGYGAAFAEMAKLRTADLTPPLSEAGRESLAGLSDLIGDQDGGADAFLSFITDTLSSEIDARYPAAVSGERMLFGHSLGGLFTAYALLTRPDSFAAFLASSPSLWWDQFAVLKQLPAFAGRLAGLTRQPRVMIAVGSKEQDPPTKVPADLGMSLEAVQALVAASRMVDAAAEFAPALRHAGLSEVTFVAFDGEDHTSVVPAAMMRGMTVALSERP